MKDDVKVSGVWVTERFFEALGIPILEGQAFCKAPTCAAPPWSRWSMRRWRSATGRGERGGQTNPLEHGRGWVNIIGVAKINAFMAFGTPPLDTIFLPYSTCLNSAIFACFREVWLVRPKQLVEPVRAVMRESRSGSSDAAGDAAAGDLRPLHPKRVARS